jgi:hypothetical protein
MKNWQKTSDFSRFKRWEMSRKMNVHHQVRESDDKDWRRQDCAHAGYDIVHIST